MNKPQVIRTEVFDRKNCLFFEDLHTMMIALSSVVMLSHDIRNRKSQLHNNFDDAKLENLMEVPFAGLLINEDYSFKAFEPLKSMVNNIQLNKIELKVYPPVRNIQDVPGVHYIQQHSFFQQKIIGAAFVNFYESILDTIKSKFPGSPDPNWPAVLNFARIIRNSYSHGGRISFQNAQASSVTWRGLSYSPIDNGRFIHDKIFVVEIIELMKEMNLLVS